jgi:hypothetical protein
MSTNDVSGCAECKTDNPSTTGMAPAIISQRPSLRAWDVSLSDRTGLALNYRCPLRRAVS